MPWTFEIRCDCGKHLRVTTKHFGHMCGCPKCGLRLYVTAESVYKAAMPTRYVRKTPPPNRQSRHFAVHEVPLHWKRGDLLMGLYRVLGVRGEGGMGVVYKVHHRAWNIDMAVKTPKPKFLAKRGLLDLFEKECETWVNLLPHPNIVKCYYVRRMAGVPRAFVEYVHGGSLTEHTSERTLYDGDEDTALERILDLAIQFAWGLHHAHTQGVVHQDVKPGNLLIGDDGVAKVTDFGLAKAYAASATPFPEAGPKEDSRARGGTPCFRSPEQCRQDHVTPKIDMWGWGLSVMEMFIGALTWEYGENALETLQEYRELGPVSEGIPRMPRPLRDLLETCFQQDPNDRPDSMLGIADVLRDLYRDVVGVPYPREYPEEASITANVLNNRAVSFLDLNRTDEAGVLWQQALDIEPSHLEATFNRALHEWRSGALTDSGVFRAVRRVVNSGSEEWLSRYLYARLLLEWGDHRHAEHVLRKLDPASARSHGVTKPQEVLKESQQVNRRMLWEFEAHREPATAVFLSYDGGRALTADGKGGLRLWGLLMNACEREFEGHSGAVLAACLDNREQFVLSGSADRTLKLWRSDTGNCVRTLLGHDLGVTAVCFGPDGDCAASASLDETIKVWDMSNGQCVRTLRGHSGGVTSVQFISRGRQLLSSATDKTVRLWDVETGKCLATLEGHDDAVTGVRLSPKSGFAISASLDETAKVWNLSSGDCLRTFTGHSSPLAAVAVSDDTSYAITASTHGTLKMWDVTTCQCLHTFEGHTPLAVSQDGRFAMSGAKGGRVRLWAVYCDREPLAAPFVRSRTAAPVPVG